METTERQREANKRNAQLAKGPSDTSKTRYNATKHGILSGRVLIQLGEGKEDPEEFQRLSDAMREDFSPQGAVEELYVEDLIAIAWRMRRIHAYETAVISKQKDEALKNWDKQQPYPVAINRWVAEQTRKTPTPKSVQSTPDKLMESAVQPSEPSRKAV